MKKGDLENKMLEFLKFRNCSGSGCVDCIAGKVYGDIKNLENITLKYKEFLNSKNKRDFAERLELSYSASDTNSFSKIFYQYQNNENEENSENLHFSGFFLSSLINNSPDAEFILELNERGEKIDFLGYRLRKKLTITGNVGDFLGYYMKRGKIFVSGDAGISTASFMNGGEIHVEGKIKSLSLCIKKGKVYEKGNLVWPLEENKKEI